MKNIVAKYGKGRESANETPGRATELAMTMSKQPLHVAYEAPMLKQSSLKQSDRGSVACTIASKRGRRQRHALIITPITSLAHPNSGKGNRTGHEQATSSCRLRSSNARARSNPIGAVRHAQWPASAGSVSAKRITPNLFLAGGSTSVCVDAALSHRRGRERDTERMSVSPAAGATWRCRP